MNREAMPTLASRRFRSSSNPESPNKVIHVNPESDTDSDPEMPSPPSVSAPALRSTPVAAPVVTSPISNVLPNSPRNIPFQPSTTYLPSSPSGSASVSSTVSAPSEQELGVGEKDKKAYHNQLERKRRDHIKDSFDHLRNIVPMADRSDRTSRAQILCKAVEYIDTLNDRHSSSLNEIETLKHTNTYLDEQIQKLEAFYRQQYDEDLSDDDQYTSYKYSSAPPKIAKYS